MPTLPGREKRSRHVDVRKYYFLHLVLTQRCWPAALSQALRICPAAKSQVVPCVFYQPALGSALLSSWISGHLFECCFLPLWILDVAVWARHLWVKHCFQTGSCSSYWIELLVCDWKYCKPKPLSSLVFLNTSSFSKSFINWVFQLASETVRYSNCTSIKNPNFQEVINF